MTLEWAEGKPTTGGYFQFSGSFPPFAFIASSALVASPAVFGIHMLKARNSRSRGGPAR